jgi:hypothetical protein
MASSLLLPASLASLLQYEEHFPDFPKNFTLPPGLMGSNYKAPNHANAALVFTWIMIIVNPIMVFARLYVRKAKNSLGLDDWIIIPALVCSTAVLAIEIYEMICKDIGPHVYDINPLGAVGAQQREFAGIVLYFFAVYFIKMSIVAFLYRLFGTISKSMKLLLVFTAVFYSLLLVSSVFAYVFSCFPVAASWEILVRFLPSTHCVNIYAMMVSLACVQLAGDCWLLILPIPLIWRLKLSLPRRIGFGCIMSIGAFACLGAFFKVYGMRGVFDSWDPSCKFAV